MNDKTSKLNYTNARLLAVQVLYARALGENDWDKLMSQALLGEFGGQALVEQDKTESYVKLPAADAGLFTRIVQSYRENAEAIDTAIRTGLTEKITFERLDPILLCILRAGLAEFYVDSLTDSPVIINEYVDMARSFYDGNEVKVVNALLDRFSKIVRS